MLYFSTILYKKTDYRSGAKVCRGTTQYFTQFINGMMPAGLTYVQPAA